MIFSNLVLHVHIMNKPWVIFKQNQAMLFVIEDIEIHSCVVFQFTSFELSLMASEAELGTADMARSSSSLFTD